MGNYWRYTSRNGRLGPLVARFRVLAKLYRERESDLEFIRDAFGERFGIKNVDPRYFLGCLMEIEHMNLGK